MNCDQAFDAITDPGRSHRADLAEHLRACPRCRQMYETLEPALGLFAADQADSDLPDPGIPTRQVAPSTRLAQQIAARLASRNAPTELPRRRLWAAVFAAVVAGFLLSVGTSAWSPTPPMKSPVPARACLWLNQDAAPSDQTAGTLIMACVNCHSRGTLEATQQTQFRHFSRDVEQLLRIGQPWAQGGPLLIAGTFRSDLAPV